MLSRSQIRRQMRQQRRRLSPSQQRRHSLSLLKHLKRQPEFIRARHIALYLENDGEISTRALIEYCRTMRKTLYLPVLHPVRHNRLWFVPLNAHSRMRKNRYGIEEPDIKGVCLRNAKTLSLVLLPLVAFDLQGGRLGMGGGYYDRSFAFKLNSHANSNRPQLIGLAHDFQQVAQLPLEPWDVPLAAVATEAGVYRAAQSFSCY